MAGERDALESALCDEHVRAVIATVAGGLAHHFNNLLSGVLGLVSLAPTLDPAAMANLGDRVKVQIDHASRLIRVVLTLTRRAQSEDAMGQCEAVGQARDVVALAAVTAKSSVAVEPDLPVEEVLVPLSAVRIDRILLVLLTAAIDRTGDEGSVRLRMRPDGDECEFTISATGSCGGTVRGLADVVVGDGLERGALSKLAASRLITEAGGRIEYGSGDAGLKWQFVLPRLRLS